MSSIKTRQIMHIKEHLVKFGQLTRRSTVEEYFDEYYDIYRRDKKSLYSCLCQDLNLDERKDCKDEW